MNFSIIVPEVIEIYTERFGVLFEIYNNGIIGRRKLSQNLNIPERKIRHIIEKFKKQGIVYVESNGVRVTDLGENIINDMSLREKIRQELQDKNNKNMV